MIENHKRELLNLNQKITYLNSLYLFQAKSNHKACKY